VTGDSDVAPIDRRLSDSNQAWLGKVVDGRYRVLEVIGRGGMGVVYRVEHLRMGKIAAMKVLHRDLADDPEVVQRFEREAAAVSRLHHPHTVQVFDFGTAQGALYLIMEYVRGLDLAHIIQRDGPMPWARAAPLLAQICGALQEAHELGVIHRDLKPENVLITRTTGGRDYAKVLDFGLAKLDPRAGDAPGRDLRETERQQIVGTPYFMAPEQIRGEAIDARTDLYSFGALMFELLTGQHLYMGSTAVGVLTKHLTGTPDAPSMRSPKLGIPPAVDAIAGKALAKDPKDRWQSAAELAEVIEEVYGETVHDATGPGRSRRVSQVVAPVSPLRGQTRTRLTIAVAEQASELRLRRSDIDAFERGMQRRRAMALGGTAVIALGAVAAGAWFVLREQPPVTAEVEPNDTPDTANRISAGAAVTGYLGKRRSETEPDRDLFVVPWPASSHHVVTIRVTALPNIDLDLQEIDGDGAHGAAADEAGVGGSEVMHRRAIDGPLTVTVSETLAKGALPVENVSDAYTLTVTEEPEAGGESEPNNLDADANPLAATEELSGYLDTRADIDQLRFSGATGTYQVVVRADGLPMSWRTGDGKWRTPGAATVPLEKGELLTLQRTDRTATGALVGAGDGPPGRDAPWTIVVLPIPAK
jgi:serine/threonine-protein kinase